MIGHNDTRPARWRKRGLIPAALIFWMMPAFAQAPGATMQTAPGSERTIAVPAHKSRIVDLGQSIRRVSVGDPSVANILILRSRQIYIVGKRLGSTNVLLWGRNGRVSGTLDVEVTHDLNALKEKLYRFLPGEQIDVSSSQNSIVLSGEVSSSTKMDAALNIARSFLQEDGNGKEDKKGPKVLNMMQVGGAKQVMLEVQVAEVSRSLTRRLGIKFNALDGSGSWKVGAVSGGATLSVPSFDPKTGAFDGFNPHGLPFNLDFKDLSIADKGLFAGRLAGEFLFNIVIDAAKENGLAKILAEPTLTTLTGQEATFLSGGEFPIPVPQGVNGTTIEFKEFGIGLRFLPVVLDSGNINLKIKISVSELTSANSAVIGVSQSPSSFFIPALTKRSANATVELTSGQTMGIAGLIDENLRQQINKFPGLGDVPILGTLFRSQEFVKGQTELVIFVTPHFAKPTRKELVRLPTDAFVEPDDVDFYLLGHMEGKRPNKPLEPQSGGMEGRFGHQL